MAWEATTPLTKTYAIYQIVSFHFSDLDEVGPRSCTVEFKVGESVADENAPGGVRFIEHERRTAVLPADAVEAASQQVPPEGVTLSDAVGISLYGLLAEAGFLPPGTLT